MTDQKQQNTTNNEWAKHVNWGAYYFHKGIQMTEEENEYKRKRWESYLKPTTWISGIIGTIRSARENAYTLIFLSLITAALLYFSLPAFDRRMLWLKTKVHWMRLTNQIFGY